MRRLLALYALTTLLAPAALAGDKDKKDDDDFEDDPTPKAEEFEEEEEEGEDAPPARIEEEDTTEKDPDDLDFTDEEEEGPKIEFKDDEIQEDVKPRGPGEDTAALYRDAQKKYGEMTPEEELLAWERYLQKYPKSLFADRIEERTEEISTLLFGERVAGSDKGARMEDAALQELNFAVPVQFAPIDTRSRISAGVEVGIPNWFGPRLDFEYALLRQLSVHAGLQREYTNFTITPGAKYALIKSARTGTLLTAGLDFKIYSLPAYFGLKPSIGFGQRLDVLEGLDIQTQVAIDPEFRDPLGLRYFWGLSGQLQANETVSVFVETSTNFKYLGNEDFGPFRFMVATFGMKFTAAKARASNGDGRADVAIGANFPYSINYWGFYRGAVNIDADYYL